MIQDSSSQAAEPPGDGLGDLSAAAQAELLRRGEICAVDLADDFIARCAQRNPAINAIVALDQEAARRSAEASDARRRAGAALGPLDGIPVTVKDNLFLAGFRATWGSRLFRDFVPDEDDAGVARLRALGANLLAKTNTPEFALGAHTDNFLFGPTRNPWRLDLTPGGSSGGAVAALAAGIGALAVGTDAGGSIRRPAAYAGVVGFRPSNGRIPRTAGFPPMALDLQAVAPAARSVDDVYLLFRSMAGPDARDRASRCFADYPLPQRLDAALPGSPARICYVPEVESSAVDRDIRQQAERAARLLEGGGHRVETGTMPFALADIERIWSTLTAVAVARLAGDSKDALAALQPSNQAAAARGRAVDAQQYAAAVELVQQARRRVDAHFERFDFILSPTSACLPWPVGQAFPQAIDGQPAGPRAGAVFSTFANVAGIPAVSVPVGIGDGGLPVGVQLAGRFGADLQVLALARQLESMAGWRARAPAAV